MGRCEWVGWKRGGSAAAVGERGSGEAEGSCPAQQSSLTEAGRLLSHPCFDYFAEFREHILELGFEVVELPLRKLFREIP